jgi:Coenzyme F390 synthetase
MYLTCLYNFSQPLIRYHISDRIELIPASKSFPFSRCSVIQSREEDVMWFTDGIRREFVHPLSVEGFCIEGLTDYQFIQKGNDFFKVILQTSSETDFVQRKNIGIKIKEEIQKVLDEKQLDFVHFEILFAECIKPEANGKKKLIVRCA